MGAMDDFWQRWLAANRAAEQTRDWSGLADFYAEDATYGWMYTPDEHFMAVGRQQIREWALGTEMAGLDGWHYDYVATMTDERQQMVLGFWKQRAGIDDEDGREYEVLGIGGSWFGLQDGAGRARDRLAARLVRPRRGRGDVPGRRGLRPGAAGAAGPDGARRPVPARPLPPRRPALDDLAAARRGRRARHPGGPPMTPTPPRMLVDGKLVEASSGGHLPDRQPRDGAADRRGSRRHGRGPRRGDLRGPPGLRRHRLVDRTTTSGCTACASSTRRWWRRARRCGR